MKIVINGEEKTFALEKLSVADLLKIENIAQPDMVSVQLNDEFIRQEEYGTTKLKEGDEINFLYFMGGGAIGIGGGADLSALWRLDYPTA
ncbi:MAG: sulfur carrier protein ThiS [Helicobacteraceae bacterium]|jgi:sulfur carrier protein|nr:sulfur carrier protein ThiS [Helicobacteraceae bacterium]